MIQPVTGLSPMAGPFGPNAEDELPDPGKDVTILSRLSRVLNASFGAQPEPVEGLPDFPRGSRFTNVFEQIDSILNLGSRRNFLGVLSDLSREELAKTFAILSDLFDRGIVGYEYREINGEPHKVFIDVAIGSDAHRAPLYRDGRLDGYL